MGHEFPWEDPSETPIGEDPVVDIGRPSPGLKQPDPMGWRFDFGDWWEVAKWAYVGFSAAGTTLGLIGLAEGWVPAAYWGFVLQIAGLATAACMDESASSAGGDRRRLPDTGRWDPPGRADHPELAAHTAMGACLDRSLDLARDASLLNAAVRDYASRMQERDGVRALAARQAAEASLDGFRARALEAAAAYDRAVPSLPKELQGVVIARRRVTNVVQDIVRTGRLPDKERYLLSDWPPGTEERLVAELRSAYRERSLPETLSGATMLVHGSGALRHLARYAHIFLPNGM